MKILIVAGTRPQLIKISQLTNHFDWLNTGQHYDELMNDVFMKELKIKKPIKNLDNSNLGEMISLIEGVLQVKKYDAVLVVGDTNSTLAGAIAAKQQGKVLIHLEAGCRSGNMTMIEEQNRIMVDHISDYLLCCSEKNVEQLEEKEKVAGITAHVGHIGIDTIWSILPIKPIEEDFYFMTLHRAENVDNEVKLKEIIKAIGKIPGKVKFAVHPRTENKLKEFKITLPKNVEKLEPLNYKETMRHVASAKKVLTDSGSLQVEAHFLATPCITLRDETEWTETLENNRNILVGSHEMMILSAIRQNSTGSRNFYYGGSEGGKITEDIIFLLKNL